MFPQPESLHVSQVMEMIDNTKPYKDFTFQEKFDIAFYCLHQLFSYCLLVEEEDMADAMAEFEINKDPELYLSRTKDLLRGIKVNEIYVHKLKELKFDTVDILDNISLEMEHRYRDIMKDYELMNIYDRNAFKLFELKME